MSRPLRALVLLMLVASCGSSNVSAPRNLDDACALVAERPQYLRAMTRAEREWGVPVPILMAFIHQESKFVGNARTPHRYALGVIPVGRQSSAYGYSQALDGTWDDYLAERGTRRAKRDDIRHATDFMGWYMDGTTRALGIPKTDPKRQYLAYHDGRAGYRRGTHLRKGWLLDVSDRVARRAQRYEAQLVSCGRR